MYDFLKKVPLFSDLPDADLQRLCEIIDEIDLPAGTFLFHEGSDGDRAYVIKEGQLEILKSSGGREVLLALRKSGEVIGEMALLEDAPRMASVRALTDTRLISIHQVQFEDLLDASPSAARAMLNTMLARFRSTEAMLRQSEKMAQLGTLSAGVAHELNNPAAAVKRSADQLQSALDDHERALEQLDWGELSDPERDVLHQMADKARASALLPPEMDALARSDREAELEDWLDDHGVDEAWELAPLLVDFMANVDDLDILADTFAADRLSLVITWLSAVYRVRSLLVEVGQGAGRISEIVRSLKAYSYLDQAPVQEVDIHEGLDNTLVILRSKLKQGVSVRRDYAEALPKIQAYGSELNQVWTNILDNAADALIDGGTGIAEEEPLIVVRTRQEGEWVVVEFQDNGPGIPEDKLSRVFDPFFTTKPPGKGTGLGLDISYRIVVNKHAGDIKVVSHPGFTCFQVILPLDFEKARKQSAPVISLDLADDAQLRKILEESKTIATVGYSSHADNPGHTVPAYLHGQGYRIIPVNPHVTEALGEKAYPELSQVPDPIDVVQVFRRSEYIPEIVDQAIKARAKTIWMQEGIVHDQAADLARRAGLQVVMNACMRTAHRRLMSRD